MTKNKKQLKISILTLFPEMFPGALGYSVTGNALNEDIWGLDTINIRDFATDKHKTVDDTPYGGGAGMVMRPDIIARAVDSLESPDKFIYMSPRGTLLTQKKAIELLKYKHLTILCGRYEGVDQRVLDKYNFEEISIGDYILSGGEIAAMVLIDSCIRNIPGVLGNLGSRGEESFGAGIYENLLEYPHFTRPAEWEGETVPSVLLSGNHAEITKWRLEQAENITHKNRPDLWKKYKQDIH